MTGQLSPGAARRTSVRAGRHRLAVLEAGPASGPVVLLIPGYTGSKEDFAPLLDPLAEQGWHALALDLPGQYESPPLPEPRNYASDQLAAPIGALAEQFGGPVHLVGHSFGGLVARAAVIAAPDRYASLVLLSSGPAAIDGLRRVRIDQLEPVLARTGLPGVYAAMQAAAAAEPGFAAPPPELAEFLERRFLRGSPIMLQGMADALRTERDRVAELAATGIATLVVHGADDDAWPPHVQREMAERLGARYAVIPDAAHSAAVENPATLLDVLLSFWER
jgi:pimeloyl-ACP methyl ester carboxylesterase